MKTWVQVSKRTGITQRGICPALLRGGSNGLPLCADNAATLALPGPTIGFERAPLQPCRNGAKEFAASAAEGWF
jgi:hypothetical protein